MTRRILFPVDFSSFCLAMAHFVNRAAAMFGAEVTLVHVGDLCSQVDLQELLIFLRLLPTVCHLLVIWHSSTPPTSFFSITYEWPPWCSLLSAWSPESPMSCRLPEQQKESLPDPSVGMQGA